jgi:putative transposase
MSRPLRIEFEGAIYHVTSRGDRREPIYRDDLDRTAHLAVVAQAMERFDAQVLAYCLMGNHYHLVLHTRSANLSRLMRHLNGVYTQTFNRRHNLVGHLFQGRFKAILVDRDAYLLEVVRYVELNPVRAAIASDPLAWPWSSYAAHVGQTPTPPWLDSDGLHSFMLGRAVAGPADSRSAALAYARHVADGVGRSLWETALRQQVYLGDEDFVEKMQRRADPSGKDAAKSREIPKTQRLAPRTFQQCLAAAPTREAALLVAYRNHGITMTALAAELGLSVSRISRLIARAESDEGRPEVRGRVAPTHRQEQTKDKT